jgi:hypothetical protein
VTDPEVESSIPDDTVPISVRLGTVVPPEDPEDWTRPLTWVVAVGMLAGPATALAWFVIAPPRSVGTPLFGTWLIAGAIAVGAATAGATQIGRLRSFTGTLGAGLFGALTVVLVGLVTAGERQVAVASPTLAHAFGAAVAGVVGSLAAAVLAPWLSSRTRVVRTGVAAAVGGAAAALLLPLLFGSGS